MGRILQMIQAFFAANPAKLQVISKVAGKKLASPQAVANWAKGNKVNMALTAANMGSSGLMIADYMTAEGDMPEAASNIISKLIEFVPDVLPADAKLSLDDLDKYHDELQMIRNVSARLGGLKRLLELRAVLALPDSYFDLHQAVERLSR